jgi:hypothetical protein
MAATSASHLPIFLPTCLSHDDSYRILQSIEHADTWYWICYNWWESEWMRFCECVCESLFGWHLRSILSIVLCADYYALIFNHNFCVIELFHVFSNNKIVFVYETTFDIQFTLS